VDGARAAGRGYPNAGQRIAHVMLGDITRAIHALGQIYAGTCMVWIFNSLFPLHLSSILVGSGG